MKKTALFLFFIFVTSLSFAQQSTEWNKNYVTFSPLRIIDFFNPGIEFAYQRNYGHFATQFSAAYLMGISTMGAKDISGYRFSLEEKYFIPRLSKQKIRLFASIEIAHNGISYSKEKAYIAE
ncbi:MAG: hypothetical protein LBS46_00750, partial [Dysgonamonadaceae bacterium]|nr:hypothetical protein [Dysgonamonadaceae bacterium]